MTIARKDFEKFPDSLKKFLKFHPDDSVRAKYINKIDVKNVDAQNKIFSEQEHDVYKWFKKEKYKNASRYLRDGETIEDYMDSRLASEKLARKKTVLESEHLDPNIRDAQFNIIINNQDNKDNQSLLDSLVSGNSKLTDEQETILYNHYVTNGTPDLRAFYSSTKRGKSKIESVKIAETKNREELLKNFSDFKTTLSWNGKNENIYTSNNIEAKLLRREIRNILSTGSFSQDSKEIILNNPISKEIISRFIKDAESCASKGDTNSHIITLQAFEKAGLISNLASLDYDDPQSYKNKANPIKISSDV